MHFTVVFNSHESHDLSYGLVFIPCPVWIAGSKQVLNLHPQTPHYVRGDLQRLLEVAPIEQHLAPGTRSARIIVHSSGHATEADLDGLRGDLTDAGFTVAGVSLG